MIRHQHEALVQDQVERLLGELQSLRGQLSAAQQRLDSQTAAASGTVANLENRIASLQTELHVLFLSTLALLDIRTLQSFEYLQGNMP